jgi:hypothetical protein
VQGFRQVLMQKDMKQNDPRTVLYGQVAAELYGLSGGGRSVNRNEDCVNHGSPEGSLKNICSEDFGRRDQDLQHSCKTNILAHAACSEKRPMIRLGPTAATKPGCGETDMI